MAARFYRVACLMESTSRRRPERASEVAFVCFASQQPNLFKAARACAAATPGVRKDAVIILVGFQNVTSSEQSELKA